MLHQRRKGDHHILHHIIQGMHPHHAQSLKVLRCRFGWGLGMQYVAKSDLSTGNTTFASHVLESNDLVCQPFLPLQAAVCTAEYVFPETQSQLVLPPGPMDPTQMLYPRHSNQAGANQDPNVGSQVFAFTAPYSQRIEKNKESKVPCPWYRPEEGLRFIEAHGLGVRAVGAPQDRDAKFG